MLRAQLIFIFVSSAALAAESAGMPQLDPKSWVPQIFWLIITFGFLYIVISRIVFPRLSESIEQRNDYISDLVDEAKKLAEQTEQLNKQYENFIINTNTQAQEIIINDRKKLNTEFNKKQDELNNKINKITVEAEKEIKDFKSNSINQIQIISKNLTDELLKDLSIKELIDQRIILKNIDETCKKIRSRIS
tara:strand:+ start:1035 stop:1607 length:573 start_codon:yes stop_codon:yes gene_type:complete